jgi:type VI protein secretion system component Hcp
MKARIIAQLVRSAPEAVAGHNKRRRSVDKIKAGKGGFKSGALRGPRSLIFCAGAALMGLTAPMAYGAEQFFMQIPNVPGDVTVAQYAGWISVSSFSMGFSNATTRGGKGLPGLTAGIGTCQPIAVVKPLDLTSPALSMSAYLGTAYPTVTLVGQTDGSTAPPVTFLSVTLTNAIIDSVTLSGNPTTSAQFEALTLEFDRIQVTYYIRDLTIIRKGPPVLTPVTHTIDCANAKAF